jgi:hypothetical protein
MPRQNRVTPRGELIAVPDRGMFWGNRGSLLDARGRLVRRAADGAAPVTVITPRATAATLAAGYPPVVHPSAAG